MTLPIRGIWYGGRLLRVLWQHDEVRQHIRTAKEPILPKPILAPPGYMLLQNSKPVMNLPGAVKPLQRKRINPNIGHSSAYAGVHGFSGREGSTY